MSRRKPAAESMRIDLHLGGRHVAWLRAEMERSGQPVTEVIRRAIRIAYGSTSSPPDPEPRPMSDPDPTRDPDPPKTTDPDQSGDWLNDLLAEV